MGIHAQVIHAVVFDLGGVLIDWNPRYLYRKIFSSETEVTWFLQHVCTMEWNSRQDEGRTWAEAVAEQTARFPRFAEQIRAYDERWHEMLGGPLDDSVTLLEELSERGVPLYSLTNWSAEKYHHAAAYPFMDRFRGVLVSGHEGIKKPDPRVFSLLASRYRLHPQQTLFVDDVKENVEAAARAGFLTFHFLGAGPLRERLSAAGLLSPRTPETSSAVHSS